MPLIDIENRLETVKRYKQLRAMEHHLDFINYTWQNRTDPFVIGVHTRRICGLIDTAIARYRKGKSSFYIIKVPFRHGKALAVETPVLTARQWKTHGELQAGDYVFNDKGQLRMVVCNTGAYEWDTVKITFHNKESVICAKEHLWRVSKDLDFRKGVMRIKPGRGCIARVMETKDIVIPDKDASPLFVEAAKPYETKKNRYYIKSIEPYKKAMVNCIQVEGGMYLAGKGLIPTHNSEIISRKLPAHYLGLFPDGKVLLCGHTMSLSVGYSKESRDLMRTVEYHELFPDTAVNPTDSAAGHWKIFDHSGECYATGLGGAMAGQGYTLGLLDDYCRNRLDAESPTMRQNMWDSFTNDFMTRRAPVSITMILATPWHTDDVIARVENKMKTDNTFPKFEVVTMPAFSEEYPTGTLFPERFTNEWYEEQKATLGEYGTAALLQMSPVARGGNMIAIDKIQRHNSLNEYPEDLRWYRIWDLAHTAKERQKDDPDYTAGTLLAFRIKPGTRQWELWVKDVARFRKAAPERDNMIRHIAESDGPLVKIGVEDTVDSKDAFVTLRAVFEGRRVIQSARGRGDKVMRASPLEPIFEAGNVHIPLVAPWLSAWIAELSAFPSGAHDDMVDNLSAGYYVCTKAPGITSAPLMGT